MTVILTIKLSQFGAQPRAFNEIVVLHFTEMMARRQRIGQRQ